MIITCNWLFMVVMVNLPQAIFISFLLMVIDGFFNAGGVAT